ncbi:hypothetical protein ACIP2X_25480 [Streptomyces sp. NPDC089424]|uniref:hypothetical protein n=1 Tax=Streptomyces sp. NPDC089424 TaxID=3365917 RepID=UPI003817B306
MTASSGPSQTDLRAVAALCALLGAPDELRSPGIRQAAERARDLLCAGADADELDAAYREVDTALRRAGYAEGLANRSRGWVAPGVAPHTKVAVCPGPVRCDRLERARDLLPAPQCAVNDTCMSKGRLGPAR